MGLVDVVKQAAVDAIAASNPVNLLFGEVVSVNPLIIRVDQRFRLSSEFLVVTEAVNELKLVIGSVEYVVRDGLKASDKVVLVRMQGGQRYVVLDKLVST